MTEGFFYRPVGLSLDQKFGPVTSSGALTKYVMEDCAQHYFENHLAWEDSWPITFDLYHNDGSSLGPFVVEREDVPTFSASRPTLTQEENA